MRLGKIDSRVYKLCLVGLACLAGGLGAVSCRPHRVIRIRVPAAVLSAMEASQVDAVDAAGSIATPASANPTDGNRYANLPAFQPGAVIELPAGTVPINRLSAVDSAFRQRYITGNPLMRPGEPDNPSYSARYFFWGTIAAPGLPEHVIVLERAGADHPAYRLYLLCFDQAGQLQGTLELAENSQYLDTTIVSRSVFQDGLLKYAKRTEDRSLDDGRGIDLAVRQDKTFLMGSDGRLQPVATAAFNPPDGRGQDLWYDLPEDFFSRFRIQDRRPRFFLLGWSSDHRLAYIVEQYEPESASLVYTWTILDFEANQVVWTTRDTPTATPASLPPVGQDARNAAAFRGYFAQAIPKYRDQLLSNGIISDNESAMGDFPWYVGESIIRASADRTIVTDPELGVDLVMAYGLSVDRDGQRQTVHAPTSLAAACLEVQPFGRLHYPYDHDWLVIVSALVMAGPVNQPNRLELAVAGTKLVTGFE